MKLFTLIHICSQESSLHNSRTKNFDDQIRLYLVCAKNLHASLKQENLDLSILTNDKQYLSKFFSVDWHIEVIELPFTLQVPSGIKFYSAHFKLEVFNFLANCDQPYVGVLDSDMLCVNKMPKHLRTIIQLEVPLYYDITDQTAPAYGLDVLISDKEKLTRQKSLGIWAGGEFISGPPSFFAAVYKEVEEITTEYFANFHLFHHQGDEMITSVAIENLMMAKKFTIIDAGSLGIVGRFWGVNTLHVQKSVEAYLDHFLIHLPADKAFLSGLSDQQLKSKRFFNKYRMYLLKKSLRKGLGKIVRKIKRS